MAKKIWDEREQELKEGKLRYRQRDKFLGGFAGLL